MVKIIHGSGKDNVVTCCEKVEPGTEIKIEGKTIRAKDEIPIYHKMACKEIAAGETVYKYGEPIGAATVKIAPGRHVHTQNIESNRGRGDKKGEAQ